MSDRKFTPGPWEAVYDADGDHAIFGGDNVLIGSTSGKGYVDAETDAGNAHLFAASLDLYVALKELLALVEGEAPGLLRDDHHYDMVRAALAKAEAPNE